LAQINAQREAEAYRRIEYLRDRHPRPQIRYRHFQESGQSRRPVP
jgi:hypothetical protein